MNANEPWWPQQHRPLLRCNLGHVHRSSLSVYLSVCLCVYLCVYHKKCCPLASVESFGDIAIICCQQLDVVALRRSLVLVGNPSKNIDAIRYPDVLCKGYY